MRYPPNGLAGLAWRQQRGFGNPIDGTSGGLQSGGGFMRPGDWGPRQIGDTGYDMAPGPNKWDSPRFPPGPTWWPGQSGGWKPPGYFGSPIDGTSGGLMTTGDGSTPAIGMPPIPAFSSDPNLGKPPMDFGNPWLGTSGGLQTRTDPPIFDPGGLGHDAQPGPGYETPPVRPGQDFGPAQIGPGYETPPGYFGSPIDGTSGGLQTTASPVDFGSPIGGTSGGLMTTAAPVSTADTSWYDALKTQSAAAPASPNAPTAYTSALAGLQQQPQNNDLASWLSQMRKMGLNTGSSF